MGIMIMYTLTKGREENEEVVQEEEETGGDKTIPTTNTQLPPYYRGQSSLLWGRITEKAIGS